MHGVWLSLNLKSSLEYSTSMERRMETSFPKETIHPLFEVCFSYSL